MTDRFYALVYLIYSMIQKRQAVRERFMAAQIEIAMSRGKVKAYKLSPEERRWLLAIGTEIDHDVKDILHIVTWQSYLRWLRDEKQGKVTLNTLQNVAEAMDCIFVYGLVPRESLQQTIQEQARRAAIKRMSRSNQMMRLEKQELTAPQKQKALHEMIEEILNTMPRTLWDE